MYESHPYLLGREAARRVEEAQKFAANVRLARLATMRNDNLDAPGSKGSHMPLSVNLSGWNWRNPLNVLPLGVLILVLVGVVLMLH